MAAVPIPIRGGRTSKPTTVSWGDVGSQEAPHAPLIGSLPPPRALAGDMPDLSLPPSTPEAFSLVRNDILRVMMRIFVVG